MHSLHVNIINNDLHYFIPTVKCIYFLEIFNENLFYLILHIFNFRYESRFLDYSRFKINYTTIYAYVLSFILKFYSMTIVTIATRTNAT